MKKQKIATPNTVEKKRKRRDWGKYMLGLGKDVWKGVDVDAYIREGRRDRKLK